MASVMRIAVLADVHGNAPALRAVLAEIDETGPEELLSDSLLHPVDAGGVTAVFESAAGRAP